MADVTPERIPEAGLTLTAETRLRPGTYLLTEGIRVQGSNFSVHAEGVHLIGARHQGVGCLLEGTQGVTVEGLTLSGFHHGVVVRDAQGVTLRRLRILDTAQVPADTDFLDIWRPAERAYGAGLLLERVRDSLVTGCDLQHQQNGLLSYHGQGLTVRGNRAHYSSGFGFHLYGTCDSTFEDNGADYCCRFEPREGGLHFGHMGADAAGFVAVAGSSRNRFVRNTARLGGDGFFLAGLGPGGQVMGCDDNLFEENDASLSPNIAFEATFCRGNVFRGNYADRCNYGFWLGYSWDTRLEGNRMVHNRQAGLAVENGHAFTVRGNQFHNNAYGLLLWSSDPAPFLAAYPTSETSYNWEISGNTLARNGVGVRIADWQDHGVRPLGAPRPADRARPHDHRLLDNTFDGGQVAVQLVRARGTLIQGNRLLRHEVATLQDSDSELTTMRNNLGAVGGYL